MSHGFLSERKGILDTYIIFVQPNNSEDGSLLESHYERKPLLPEYYLQTMIVLKKLLF